MRFGTKCIVKEEVPPYPRTGIQIRQWEVGNPGIFYCVTILLLLFLSLTPASAMRRCTNFLEMISVEFYGGSAKKKYLWAAFNAIHEFLAGVFLFPDKCRGNTCFLFWNFELYIFMRH
jgi:hypothetical protein